MQMNQKCLRRHRTKNGYCVRRLFCFVLFATFMFFSFFCIVAIVQMSRYHHEGYFPGPTVNQNRRPNPNTNNYRKDATKSTNKSNSRYNSYVSSAPKPPMNKTGPKYYGNHGYDTTPIKGSNGGKSQYESINNSNNNNHAGNLNNPTKRDTVYATPDVSNTMPPPTTPSPYYSPYMSYVPYDGTAEHPPMYMPMNVFPSSGKHTSRFECIGLVDFFLMNSFLSF